MNTPNSASAKLDLSTIRSAVGGTAAAFRCRRRLQPGGGAGDKVFPPTYSGGVYAVEQRRVPGRTEPVPCVLLDSVQSQANRMEEALQAAIDAKALKLPLIVVDFSKENLPEPVGRLTSLQLPHRFADAILRDSEHDGKRFRESDAAKGLNAATPLNATSLFELCPTALLFGSWDSTGPKGGLGTKFERAMVSEAVGIGAALDPGHKNRGIRKDPLEASKAVPLLKRDDSTWGVADDPKAKGIMRPSEVNHGSVPFENANAGVTIEHAEQITTLSLIVLRRLRFPVASPLPIRKPPMSRLARSSPHLGFMPPPPLLSQAWACGRAVSSGRRRR